MFRSPSLWAVLLAVAVFAFIGCNDDELTTLPLGIVVVNGGPEPLQALWTLRVAGGLYATGEGDSTLLNLDSGQYVLTWEPIEGWDVPDPAVVTQTLKGNGSVTFTGLYSQAALVSAAIVVDPDPSELNVPWTLTGPESFLIESRGDTIFYNMPLGDYELNWGDVEGWDLPDPAVWSGTLANGDRVQVTGVYVEQPGRIVVTPNPAALSAPWHIDGPDTLITGTGPAELTGLASGEYSIVWEDVAGWSTPQDIAETLVPGGEIVFESLYIRQYTQISAGTFTMGSVLMFDETPHVVTLTNDFQIGTTEVTNQQYCDMLNWAFDNARINVSGGNVIDRIDGSNAILYNYTSDYSDISYSAGDFSCERPYYPVREVTWYGAAAYCDWLNLQAGEPAVYNHSTWEIVAGDFYLATGWRLPTEAEWEFACRAGATTLFASGDCLSADDDANFYGSLPLSGCPVSGTVGETTLPGTFATNAFGLMDMHGNVAEWCWDIYADDYYDVSPGTDPTGPAGPAATSPRVVRGGGYSDGANACRAAARTPSPGSLARSYIGFRIVKTN